MSLAPGGKQAGVAPLEGRQILQRAAKLKESLACCTICPRRCRVDRLAGELGRCGLGAALKVSSIFPHFGEERELVGAGGSGTVFLASCNLRCSFCQNYDISHLRHGSELSPAQLAKAMLELERLGCHNINFVTPTHLTPQIVEALGLAREWGLAVPVVWNTSGYESVETLRWLKGIVDIYMPDFKFWESHVAAQLADAPDYPEVARQALKEMHEQVGDLVIDKRGAAQRGLLVRHLVMPGSLSETRSIMRFIAREISPDTFVNLMPQYYPCGTVDRRGPLGRRLTREEYEQAVREARQEGIWRLAR
jgi:putative pyruvate formate lyase activating enzyme